jgi:hypothetical protein
LLLQNILLLKIAILKLAHIFSFIIPIFMKQRGRSTDQALLRTAINKKYQTYSHKRLIKDLEEI